MTITADIAARVRELRAYVKAREPGYQEQAHINEDAIYLDVLRAIAAGAPDAAGIARTALKASEIPFEHWYV